MRRIGAFRRVKTGIQTLMPPKDQPRYDQCLVEGSTMHVLFCGGFHSSMRGTKASHLAQLCQKRGLSYTRFDYRGHGETPGDLDRLHLGDWLDDTLEVLANCGSNVLLVGSSMGAWLAVLAARAQPERISGLMLMAAAPDFITELLWAGLSSDQKSRIQDGEIIRVPNGYDDELWPLHKALFDSGRQFRVLDSGTLGALTCPTRLLHGTADTDVPWRQSLRLMDEMPEGDVSLLLLKGVNHRLSDERSLDALAANLDELLLQLQ